MEKKTDRHLQAPQEANRDKHINFKAIEDGDADPAAENTGNEETQSSFKEKVVEKKKNKAAGNTKDKFSGDDQAH